MNKVITSMFVAFCALAFVLVGCSKKQGAADVPKFKSDNVNAYLKDYAAYCGSAEQIYKDPQQYAQMQKKMEAFAKRQAEVVKELQGADEITAFNKSITQIREHLEKVRLDVLKSGGGK